MKLDYDCFRAILLFLESTELNKRVYYNELSAALPAYKNDDISYCLLKLYESGYIDASKLLRNNQPMINCIYDITFAGHEFLNNIKSDTLWNKTISLAKKLGITSVVSLSEIAVKVAMEAITNHFLSS